MKNTKRSLITSLVTLLLCSCMFIGSTFAWFTDTVSNTGNKIQAGTLDVGLEKWEANPPTTAGSSGQWVDISNSTTPIFNYDKWEPGYSEIVALKVVNKGTLALKYMINIVANGDATKLVEAIDVYTKIIDDPTSFTMPTSFDAVKADTTYNVTPLTEVFSYRQGAAHGALLPEGSTDAEPAKLEANESAAMIVVLHMKEDAGNEYQGLSLGTTFDINVFATQYTYEKDGFVSDQYDIDTPWMGDVADSIPQDESGNYLISNGAQLAKLSQMAKTAEGRSQIGGKTFKLIKDIDLNNVPFEAINQSDNTKGAWVFDGDNHTILNLKINGEKSVGLFTYCPGLKVKNLNVNNAEITGINQVGVIAGNGTCINIENCTVKNATVTTSVYNNDDGDKAGVIVGYLCADAGTTNAQVLNCKVEDCAVKGYRDVGGIAGYLNGPSVASGNSVKNTTIINDQTNNYKNYTEDSQFDVHEIIGEKVTAATDTSNTSENVTITKIAPIVVPEGKTATVAVREAVSAANAGDTLVLPKTDDGVKLPTISNNISLVGDGTTKVDATGSGSIASVPNGVTFEDLVFDFGGSNYHGFQHAGDITFKNCTLNGLFFSYGNMKFENCTFNTNGGEYSMWAYGKDLTFDNCVFNGQGKWINVYCEDNSESYNVTFNDCKFVNTGVANKAAVNVKDTCGSNHLMYNVNINHCTTEGSFPEASTSDTKIVFNNLVMIDDIKAGETKLNVKVDGVQLYPAN